MADDGEILLLATCPSCESTICIEVSRLSLSGRWRTEVLRKPSADQHPSRHTPDATS